MKLIEACKQKFGLKGTPIEKFYLLRVYLIQMLQMRLIMNLIQSIFADSIKDIYLLPSIKNTLESIVNTVDLPREVEEVRNQNFSTI